MKTSIVLLSLIIIPLLGLAQCPTTNISFEAQEQIDSFPSKYSGCSKVDGFVRFLDVYSFWSTTQTASLFNMDSLIYIDTILGNLIIDDLPLIENLNGLQNLKFANSVHLRDLSIDSLNGLSQVKTPYMEIIDLPNLNTLAGLDSLDEAKLFIDQVGSVSLHELENYTSGSITISTLADTLWGPPNADSIYNLTIQNSPNLRHIGGFDSLRKIISLNVQNCPLLESIDTFNMLEKAHSISLHGTNLQEIPNSLLAGDTMYVALDNMTALQQ